MIVRSNFQPGRRARLRQLSIAALLSVSIHAYAASLDIAAQSLDQAILTLGKQSGENIAFPSDLASKLKAPALKGNYSVQQALDILLKATGLTTQKTPAGYSVVKEAEIKSQTLPEVEIKDNKDVSKNQLPKPYAGGKVATGGSVGILGNLKTVDIPFTQTSYTKEHIEDSQALNLGDVMVVDPSFRMSTNGVIDNFTVRGFSVGRFGSVSLNGLYGIASYEGIRLEGLERVELIKGPSTFVKGMAPSGAVGGAINLVPKRATVEGINTITTSFISNSFWMNHVDVGRRFGPDNAFGARVNVAYGDGKGPADGQDRLIGNFTVGLDYAGDRFRASIDAGASKDQMTGYLRNYAIGAAFPLVGGKIDIPSAPDNKTRDTAKWQGDDHRNIFAMGRADFDITDHLNISGAYGRSISDRDITFVTNNILNNAGNATIVNANRLKDRWDVDSAEATLKYSFNTGPVAHSVALGMTEIISAYFVSPTATVAIGRNYNIYDGFPFITEPVLDPATGVVRADASRTELRSTVISDSISAFDDKLLVTVGLRKQNIKTGTAYDEDKVTPAYGIVFKPQSNWSIYTNYVESLTAGATAPANAVNGAGRTYAPFVGKQYEIGTKYDFGNFMTTFSLFHITQQSSFLDPTTLVFSVAGKQRNQGAELQFYGEIVDGLRLLGGATYLDAELVKTAGGTNDGNAGVGAPKWLSNLGVEYDIPAVSGLTLTGLAIYTGERYINATNTQELPSWTRLDLGARYATRIHDKKVVFRGNVQNIADKDYWEGQSGLMIGQPRTVYLSATLDF